MSNYQFKSLNISQIKVDQDNPRLPKTSSQREAINKMFENQGSKIIELARHMVAHGLNPTERILVFKDGGRYVDGDGNRRITALKALETPDILDDSEWKRKLTKISTGVIPKKVECVVFKNRKDARLWISLNHQGQGNGEGRISWGSKEKDRFNNIASIGTQITNKYVKVGDINKYKKTTMDRVFGFKFVKELLNIQQNKRGVVEFSKINAQLTKSIVHSLENIKVSDVYSVKETKEFLKPVISTNTPSTRTKPTTQSRKGVIPKEFQLNIGDQKTNNIFNELKKIEVTKFPNASAILFRAFFELTVIFYFDKEMINIPTQMALKSKFKNAFSHMTLTKNEKKVLQSIVSDPNNPAHTNILNSYTHNPNHHPDPISLKTAFDNLKVFFEKAYSS